MKLYAHRVTKRYLDYGHYLETVEGLAWSTTGKAQDACFFEEGPFDALLAKKRAIGGAVIELGEAVTRRVDMNPHGLM